MNRFVNTTTRTYVLACQCRWLAGGILASVVGLGIALSPALVAAKGNQADLQCPQGGVVGQQCKDTTNGFSTSGHCTHIDECVADNYPKSSGSPNSFQTVANSPYVSQNPGQTSPLPTSASNSAGQTNAGQPNSTYQSNPSNSQYPLQGQTPSVSTTNPANQSNTAGRTNGPYPSATSPSAMPSSAIQGSDLINMAFGGQQGGAASSGKYVRFVIVNGQLYLVTPTEALRVGDALTARNAPQSAAPTSVEPAPAAARSVPSIVSGELSRQVRVLRPSVSTEQGVSTTDGGAFGAAGDGSSFGPGWTTSDEETSGTGANFSAWWLLGLLVLALPFVYRWELKGTQASSEMNSEIPTVPFSAFSGKIRSDAALKRREKHQATS